MSWSLFTQCFLHSFIRSWRTPIVAQVLNSKKNHAPPPPQKKSQLGQLNQLNQQIWTKSFVIFYRKYVSNLINLKYNRKQKLRIFKNVYIDVECRVYQFKHGNWETALMSSLISDNWWMTFGVSKQEWKSNELSKMWSIPSLYR